MLGSQGSLSIVEVCRLAMPIIDAIAYAHAEGVVHLDLSPRNILVDRNRNPRIMDFGLSQFSKSYRQPGDEIKGTPLYKSPECWIRSRASCSARPSSFASSAHAERTACS